MSDTLVVGLGGPVGVDAALADEFSVGCEDSDVIEPRRSIPRRAERRETRAVRDVQYVQADDGTHIAYRVFDDGGPGAGPDVVMSSGGLIPMEVFEEEQGMARLLEGLQAIGRLVVFDRRGLGLSDPIVDWERPVLDQWADDLAAVVAGSGVGRPAVVALDGYGVGSRFAARHPDRLARLVLYQPCVTADAEWDAWVDSRRAVARDNVAGAVPDALSYLAPSCAADATFRAWYMRAGQVGASPATAARIWDSVYASLPHEHLLSDVVTPTLVLSRTDSTWAPATGARYAAATIEGATLVELDGDDHFPFCGDVDALVAEIGAFVLGERRLPPPRRILAALLFTDLVSSTERAASLGDTRWKSVLDRHDATARAAIGRCGGHVVKTTGDGVLALVPSAGGAVRSAERIRADLGADGLAVRIGIHVGDVDRRGDDVSGLSAHVAARVMAAAGSGEILVTASARAADTDHADRFEALGPRTLKGVPGEWELFRLTEGDG